MKYLLNLSGGLDSIYTLYLHCHTKPDEKLLVHHLKLTDAFGRQELETKSVYHALDWLKQNGYTNFEYIETSIDYSVMNRKTWDAKVLAFFTGLIYLQPKYRSIKYYYSCLPKDELERLGQRELEKRWAVCKRIEQVVFNHKVETLFPIKHLSKKQIQDALPKGLIYWSCRTPINNQPCNTCHTCKQL